MAGLILKSPYYKPGSKTKKGGTRGGLANYIATREGVEILRSGMADYVNDRRGSNGMFTDEGKTINMSAIMKEVNEHPGNVWCHIFSLTREDAERLGYNRAEEWMNLLRSHRNDIAREMHIDPANLRWYAAYHQHPTHPHIHMMVWSTNPTEAYLSKRGIENIKRFMAQDIFRQDMMSVYREQTVVRDELKATFRSEMESLLSEAWSMEDKNLLVYMFQQLRKELRQHRGKKAYGYLNAETKKTVNEIVKMIAETPEIAELYDKWYEYKCATVRLYTDAMPEKIPLEENREFKSIRNMVVKAASQSRMLESEVQESYASVEREVGHLLINIGQMLCDNVPNEPQMVRVPVDSKLRREQWAKDHAVNLTM